MIVASATSPNWKKKRGGFCLAKKFAPVLDNFVANSMTFKKEITKN
jgi:hypothetical protein